MKRSSILVVSLLVGLAGCSYSPEPSPTPPTSATPPSAQPTTAPTPSGLDTLPLEGTLVSQGAATEGTVRIAKSSDTEFGITLTGFSTGAGDDLRLDLSPGALEQDDHGYWYVAGDYQYEFPGKIDPTQTEQVFVFSLASFPPEAIHSFTVYDYANRTAFGSAALK